MSVMGTESRDAPYLRRKYMAMQHLRKAAGGAYIRLNLRPGQFIGKWRAYAGFSHGMGAGRDAVVWQKRYLEEWASACRPDTHGIHRTINLKSSAMSRYFGQTREVFEGMTEGRPPDKIGGKKKSLTATQSALADSLIGWPAGERGITGASAADIIALVGDVTPVLRAAGSLGSQFEAIFNRPTSNTRIAARLGSAGIKELVPVWLQEREAFFTNLGYTALRGVFAFLVPVPSALIPVAERRQHAWQYVELWGVFDPKAFDPVADLELAFDAAKAWANYCKKFTKDYAESMTQKST